jgi:hypothetical protein
VRRADRSSRGIVQTVVSERDYEALIIRGSWPTGGEGVAPWGENTIGLGAPNKYFLLTDGTPISRSH